MAHEVNDVVWFRTGNGSGLGRVAARTGGSDPLLGIRCVDGAGVPRTFARRASEVQAVRSRVLGGDAAQPPARTWGEAAGRVRTARSRSARQS